MRLGAPVGSALGGRGQQGTSSEAAWSTPEEWASFMRGQGYGAAFCPIEPGAADDDVRAYANAATEADLTIAEVIGQKVLEFNLLDPDDKGRAAAIAYSQERLALAEQVGARCCVGLTGSRGEFAWEADAENLSDDTFALVVDTTREVIDGVNPQQAFYAPEIMSWLLPHSLESYARLVKAVDRTQFGVHLDPVNLISSPETYLKNADLTRSFLTEFGNRIKSCHAKDMTMNLKVAHNVSLEFEEVRPGLGAFDYRTFLVEIERVDPDMPLMLEHLASDDEYAKATAHIRGLAAETGVEVR